MLAASGYQFVTPTPATHARVNARAGASEAKDLRDAFGWSRPARPELFGPALLAALRAADALEPCGERLRSRVRFSTLGDAMYLHSAFPTDHANAVFFGPDTYRFCALLGREVTAARRVVDVGTGAGAGGLALAARCERLVLADVNPRALGYARVNAELAGVTHRTEVVEADVLAGVTGSFDLVVCNPPYLVDAQARSYRDGGDQLGIALGVRIVRDALARLAPGGRLVLYTGAPICGGRDVFRAAVEPLLAACGATWRYRELDPDVFGEELDAPAYTEVDRIAVIGLTATLP